ncbi:hypothetical protein ABKV19_000359 [Rosa sericea]
MNPDLNAPSAGSSTAGLNRIWFLLQSLVDLDLNLKKLGSRLLVLKGEPSEVIVRCVKEWDVKKLCFEYDTEPYYQALDVKVKQMEDFEISNHCASLYFASIPEIFFPFGLEWVQGVVAASQGSNQKVELKDIKIVVLQVISFLLKALFKEESYAGCPYQRIHEKGEVLNSKKDLSKEKLSRNVVHIKEELQLWDEGLDVYILMGTWHSKATNISVDLDSVLPWMKHIKTLIVLSHYLEVQSFSSPQLPKGSYFGKDKSLEFMQLCIYLRDLSFNKLEQELKILNLQLI